jgi:hypothetical protein
MTAWWLPAQDVTLYLRNIVLFKRNNLLPQVDLRTITRWCFRHWKFHLRGTWGAIKGAKGGAGKIGP